MELTTMSKELGFPLEQAMSRSDWDWDRFLDWLWRTASDPAYPEEFRQRVGRAMHELHQWSLDNWHKGHRLKLPWIDDERDEAYWAEHA